jgi:hypothetical protein
VEWVRPAISSSQGFPETIGICKNEGFLDPRAARNPPVSRLARMIFSQPRISKSSACMPPGEAPGASGIKKGKKSARQKGSG